MSRQTLQQAYPRFWRAYIQLGTTQRERAERLGVTVRCVSYWERGGRAPTIESLRHWPDGLRLIAADIEAQQRKGDRDVVPIRTAERGF